MFYFCNTHVHFSRFYIDTNSFHWLYKVYFTLCTLKFGSNVDPMSCIHMMSPFIPIQPFFDPGARMHASNSAAGAQFKIPKAHISQRSRVRISMPVCADESLCHTSHADIHDLFGTPHLYSTRTCQHFLNVASLAHTVFITALQIALNLHAEFNAHLLLFRAHAHIPYPCEHHTSPSLAYGHRAQPFNKTCTR